MINILMYAHIPHTGGREIRRCLKNLHVTNKYRYVHNAENIKQYLRYHKKCSPVYFILRNPSKRLVGEYCHYSELLSNVNYVNHLNLFKIRDKNKTFEPRDPLHYFDLEVNRNVMCKYVLKRTDFNIPINENDYNEIIKLYIDGKLLYDTFNSTRLNLINLSKTLNVDLEQLNKQINKRDTIKYGKHDKYKNELVSNIVLIEHLTKLNKYDYMVYNYLPKN